MRIKDMKIGHFYRDIKHSFTYEVVSFRDYNDYQEVEVITNDGENDFYCNLSVENDIELKYYNTKLFKLLNKG